MTCYQMRGQDSERGRAHRDRMKQESGMAMQRSVENYWKEEKQVVSLAMVNFQRSNTFGEEEDDDLDQGRTKEDTTPH